MVVSFGHHVRAVAASVSEAIENAALHAPNVTIMNIRLAGGTSGIDAARENLYTPRLALIFLSANLDGEARDRLSRCDPTDFIDKPILPVLIRRALQTARKGISKGQGGARWGHLLARLIRHRPRNE